MAKAKSTRAFRTISEAADELDLQPHVLRFWESKFSEIQPMKRSGGRRLYRPEDIEFLRGIKILLHREKHPIKDVQKLIRIRGPQSVTDLGRSIEHAANPKDIKDTDLLPEIKPVASARAPKLEPLPEPETRNKSVANAQTSQYEPAPPQKPQNQKSRPSSPLNLHPAQEAATTSVEPRSAEPKPIIPTPKPALDDALKRLKKLKSRWKDFE